MVGEGGTSEAVSLAGAAGLWYLDVIRQNRLSNICKRVVILYWINIHSEAEVGYQARLLYPNILFIKRSP